jgi:hypothetical protein
MGGLFPTTRKTLTCVVCVAAVGASLTSFFLVLPIVNPLRGSNEAIAADLLRQAQPGTPREEVRALIREQGWSKSGIVGAGREGDLQVILGGYQGLPFRVSVCALWEFDDSGNLRTVRVSRMVIDAP